MERIGIRRGIAHFSLAVILSFAVLPAAAQDTEGRVKDLEEAVDTLNRELDSLKRELQKTKPAGEQPRVQAASGPAFSDAGGDWNVRLGGRAQLDLRTFDPDQWLANGFSLRRARLGATVDFLTDYSVRVEGEYSGGSVSLTYGYFDIGWWNVAKIRGGQFKRMFGSDRSTSTNFTNFMERSLVDALLEGTYDRGIMVFGSPVRGVDYAFSVTNGSGASDKSSASAQQAQADDFDWTLRLTGNAADWLALKASVLHFGGSYDAGRLGNGIAGTVAAASAQTEGRGVVFFAPAAFTGSNVDRTRTGVEAALAHGPVKLEGEWIRANYQGTSAGGTDYSRDIDAYHGDLMWLVTGEHYADSYKGGSFGRIKPRATFRSGNGWGALELGLRYSHFDGGDFSAANVPGTGTISATGSSANADAISIGLKWIAVPNARLMLNYVRTDFDTPIVVNGRSDDREQAINLRAQLDF